MERTIALLFLCTAVEGQSDLDRLLSASSEKDREGWIGLQRNPKNITAWMWSNGEWNDDNDLKSMHFYCIQLTVVVEEKSWEEALEHCREHHTDLSSLLSETDNLMALREYQKKHTTERMWIGLRYLADRWLWVNGDPLEFEAWPKGGVQDHQCPIRNRCGALTKEGLWENWDCQDKLNFICL
ncbi:hypothetical protein VZT92_002474 [Zoarces viviparus]|uniref:C-type lectin domain-containing protein n=1 Tax=Zoarces viviparus TaxID=48416 RepID=A0AAW1G145_ZOAVI